MAKEVVKHQDPVPDSPDPVSTHKPKPEPPTPNPDTKKQ